MTNYTQQCRACHIYIDGHGEDICYRCLQRERDGLVSEASRRKSWWIQECNKLKANSRLYDKLFQDPEYGGGWEDLLVPTIIELERAIRTATAVHYSEECATCAFCRLSGADEQHEVSCVWANLQGEDIPRWNPDGN